MVQLTLRLLPVGRGDCALIRFPDDSWAVVDCGQKRGSYEPYTQAATFLNNESPPDTPIRFVLATHPHADHDGGILQLMEQLGQRRIHSVFFCGIERRSSVSSSNQVFDDGEYSFVQEANRRVRAKQLGECKKLEAPATIKLTPPIDGLGINVVWPTPTAVSRAKKIKITHLKGTTVNNLSVALKIDYGTNSVLLLGDLQGKIYARVLDRALEGTPIRVIKAPHHGGENSIISWDSISSVSNSPGFILISCPTGSYKHPHADFLKPIPMGKWIIRCTGLAGGCIGQQPAELWPVRPAESSLPKSLQRSLLSIGSRYRFPHFEQNAECNINIVVTLDANGGLAHSSSSRFCDTSRDFSEEQTPSLSADDL
jgi:glyoxylase-like metal-dependent hydrolase (beta-lactamase superfamily II)